MTSIQLEKLREKIKEYRSYSTSVTLRFSKGTDNYLDIDLPIDVCARVLDEIDHGLEQEMWDAEEYEKLMQDLRGKK
jgi:hypothetical protein